MAGHAYIAGMAGQRSGRDMAGGVAERALSHSLFNHGLKVQSGDCEPGRERLGGVRGNCACACLIESLASAVLVPVLVEIKPTGVSQGAEADRQEQKPNP